LRGALHAPVSRHGLFAKHHGLKRQVAGGLHFYLWNCLGSVFGGWTCLAELAKDVSVLFFVYVKGYVATTKSPAVSLGNIVDSIIFAASFLHINLHADTSNSIIHVSITKLDRYIAPNWKTASPWSPPTINWILRTSEQNRTT